MPTLTVDSSVPGSEGQPRRCPRCRIWNPPQTRVCDCGHNFQTGAKEWTRGSGKSHRSASFWSLQFNTADEAHKAIRQMAYAWYGLGGLAFAAATVSGVALAIHGAWIVLLGLLLHKRPSRSAVLVSCASVVVLIAAKLWSVTTGGPVGPPFGFGFLALLAWLAVRSAAAAEALGPQLPLGRE